ncbi:MAG: MarR family transcriptional regulator [Patescibacteria group bacterium]|jgi:MarR family 2-MHQ and catechol resistance regulon transcriptional repressor
MNTTTNKLDYYIHALFSYLSKNESAILNLVPYDINIQEFRIIYFIGQHGEKKMNDIANALQLSISNASIIVDKLVTKRLVKRINSTQDRRVIYITMAPVGEKIYRLMKKKHSELYQELLKPLSVNEQDILLGLFDKMFNQK